MTIQDVSLSHQETIDDEIDEWGLEEDEWGLSPEY